MKIQPVLLFLILSFTACQSQRGVSGGPGGNVQAGPALTFSASSRNFLKDLEALSGKTPDQAFIEKYALKFMDGKYYIGALLRVDDSFHPEELEKVQAIAGNQTKNTLSIKIPINKLSDLGEVEGINLIDIDRKIDLK